VTAVPTAAIIPARYGSKRFPGKALARETGKYLVQHVYEQVARAKRCQRVLVATDDQRILDAVRSFGGGALMTSRDHPSGTDRIAEAARTLPDDFDLILNVQGDEPQIEPEALDRLIALLQARSDCNMATLACPFTRTEDVLRPDRVKVVLDGRGCAMFFSRSVIPYPRQEAGRPSDPRRWLLHLGVYAYRRPFLERFTAWPPTPLELTEELEQLRPLEHGERIAVAVIERASIGVDTPEDYAAFVKRVKGKSG
jgi:3-deoxy-manno-octulosonate cytidylyltransferase (CMP-KDO synthetase)